MVGRVDSRYVGWLFGLCVCSAVLASNLPYIPFYPSIHVLNMHPVHFFYPLDLLHTLQCTPGCVHHASLCTSCTYPPMRTPPKHTTMQTHHHAPPLTPHPPQKQQQAPHVSEAGPQAVELAEAAAEGMDRDRNALARRAARRALEEMMDFEGDYDEDDEEGGGGSDDDEDDDEDDEDDEEDSEDDVSGDGDDNMELGAALEEMLVASEGSDGSGDMDDSSDDDDLDDGDDDEDDEDDEDDLSGTSSDIEVMVGVGGCGWVYKRGVYKGCGAGRV